jgi:ubiquinone/menaquinone biosynthesis C-methylase UbiE
MKNSFKRKMSNFHPVLKLYDKQANSYDSWNSMMERIFSKGRKIFSTLKGEILEVGVGTGLNLPYYGPNSQVTVFDWSPKMIFHAKLRTRSSNLKNIKNFVTGDIQELSKHFSEASFDYITSTCVFCSVPDPVKGLKELAKVLKPSGRLVQIEHGISYFKPVNLILGLFDNIMTKWRGFHLTRNIIINLEKSGFKVLYEIPLDSFGIVRLIYSELES